MPETYTEIVIPSSDELSVVQIGALVWNEAHKSTPPAPVLVRIVSPEEYSREKKRD